MSTTFSGVAGDSVWVVWHPRTFPQRQESTYSGHTRTAPCDLSTYPTRFDWKSRRHSERWGGCGGHGSGGGSWSQSAAGSDMWTSRASLKPASTQNSQENMVFAVNNTW